MDNFDTLPSFDNFLNEQLKDPELKAEYEALEPEYTVMQAIMEARAKKG
ncbi:MAG: hypothetical protein SPH68_06525 [Candidatus Borkfalkiaceae bacterium]|nr:hypothetical protein [Clostridia bacterium]MDY6223793.1 hypothetical protein [Christensenellaceae bacterium]